MLSRLFALCLLGWIVGCTAQPDSPPPPTEIAQRAATPTEAAPATSTVTPTEEVSPTPEATPTQRATPTLDATPTEAPTATPAATPSTEPGAAGQGTLEAEQSELVEAAEETRELETRATVPFERMTQEALRARLEADLEEEVVPEEVEAEEQMLKLLGLIPSDTDLLALTLDLYEDQIAGFYDPEEDTFYLISEEGADAPLTVTERLTFVHEYVHALQDQFYNLDRIDEEEDARSHDESRAFQALIEGDAQHAMILYFIENARPGDMEALLELEGEEGDSMADIPPFLRDSLIFPYEQGLTFVQTAHGRGGWDAVAAMWDAPPVSTEQILHPDRYPEDAPIEVALYTDVAATIGTGWTEPLRDVWGEYDLRLLLGSDRAATQAADGWGGDEYLFLTNGEQGIFALELAWDQLEEATEARTAFLGWLGQLGLTPSSGTALASATRFASLTITPEGTLRFALASDEASLASALGALDWD